MQNEQTLAIIKPLAFKSGYAGSMITQIEQAGFTITAMATANLSMESAQSFYAIHAQRPFYQDLCHYMSSGPILVMVLEKEHAVQDFRKLIGATNPAEAAPDTLRRQFGRSIDYNAVHGSDAQETAIHEIQFFFGAQGLCVKKSCACRKGCA